MSDETRKGKKRWSVVTLGAAILVLVLLCPVILLLVMNPGGGKTGDTYDAYEGPILPLTALSGAEDITGARNVDFDFAPYELERRSSADPRRVIITDSYVLNNPTSEGKTVKLAYGFQGQLTGDMALIPQLTVGGMKVEARLCPSADLQDLIHMADGWEAYEQAVTETDFLAAAMAETPAWDAPVTVYEISDTAYTGAATAEAVCLDVSYLSAGADQALWVYGAFSSFTDESTGRDHRMLQIPTEPDASWPAGYGYIMVLGSELQQLQISGNIGYVVTENSGTEDIRYAVDRYETSVSEIVQQMAFDYVACKNYDGTEISTLDTQELLYDGVMKRITDQNYTIPYDSLEEVFHEVVSDIRLLYWVFDVEIPANSTLTVEAQYEKEASVDFTGTGQKRDGYDLATRLGSVLVLDVQTASVTNGSLITMIRQNFGFDLDRGVEAVQLDPEVPRYYMDVAEN